jgi:hypothetical protein
MLHEVFDLEVVFSYTYTSPVLVPDGGAPIGFTSFVTEDTACEGGDGKG